MKINYLAHASFMITSQGNIKIITDPYTPGNNLRYSQINESADIVSVSHGHGDHNNYSAIKGDPVVLKETGSNVIKGIEVRGISSFHDKNQGNQRGKNLIFCFKVDGLNIVHLGDLGYVLSPDELSKIGHVNILLIPVGGVFTIDANEASALIQLIKPNVVIPMHFKTPKTDFPNTIDDFLKGKNKVRKTNSSMVEFTTQTLPKEPEIVVLQPAM
jgi:L-ascorbate metabolism protein UlaG (beta-lactamase superfamily)